MTHIDIVAGELIKAPSLDELSPIELLLLVRHYERLVVKLINELDVKDPA